MRSLPPARDQVAAAARRGDRVALAVHDEQRRAQPLGVGPHPCDTLDRRARGSRRPAPLVDQRIAVELGDHPGIARELAVRDREHPGVGGQRRGQPDHRGLDRRRVERDAGRGEDHPGDGGLALDRVQRGRQPAEAVAVEHDRPAGLALADPRQERVEVVEQLVDPVDLHPRAGRATVAAHVERPDRIAGADQALGEAGVAIRVIGEAVVDHHRAARLAGARPPALAVEPNAIAAREPEVGAIDVGGRGRVWWVGGAQAGVGHRARDQAHRQTGQESHGGNMPIPPPHGHGLFTRCAFRSFVVGRRRAACYR